MRLDKFLKVSRLIKRRTVAKELCDGGRILVNGSVAKAGRDVHAGDRLEINFGHKVIVVEVTTVPEGDVRREVAGQIYRTIEERTKNKEEKF
ncbi:MAG: RNA-binding S4 domain-containing protein [bacterium]